MQDILLEQLSRSTEMLISSISGGPAALQSFTHYWTQLEAAFADCALQENDEEATSIIRNNLSTIEIIAQRFLDLDEEVHSMGETFEKELDVILADLKIDDALHSPQNGSQPQESSVPPFIGPAYAWLLDNLDNPYPSKEARLDIARQSGSSCKNIDNWFTGARKRIGWSRIRRQYFSNKQSEIVSSAKAFFKDQEPRTSTHAMAFTNMQIRAEGLYDKAGIRPLPSTRKKCTHWCDVNSPTTRRAKTRTSSPANPALSYPSPEHSPTVPQSYLPSTDPPNQALKRRRTWSDSLEDSESHKNNLSSPCGPFKPSLDYALASLPSPATSVSELSNSDPSDLSSSVCLCPTNLPPCSAKRKRSLSDAESRPAKRHCHSDTTCEQLDDYSVPLPILDTSSLGWPDFCNDFPEPVGTLSLDQMHNLDFSFINFNSPHPDLVDADSTSSLFVKGDQKVLSASSELGIINAAMDLPFESLYEGNTSSSVDSYPSTGCDWLSWFSFGNDVHPLDLFPLSNFSLSHVENRLARFDQSVGNRHLCT